jgi:hypothetical protein
VSYCLLGERDMCVGRGGWRGGAWAGVGVAALTSGPWSVCGGSLVAVPRAVATVTEILVQPSSSVPRWKFVVRDTRYAPKRLESNHSPVAFARVPLSSHEELLIVGVYLCARILDVVRKIA